MKTNTMYGVILLAYIIGYTSAQGTPDITRMHVRSDITYRFATTNVSSTLRNNGDQPMEAQYYVYLPKAAFITYFEMIIDDVIYPGRVKEKKAAKKQYDRAKKKGQSAGHVAQSTQEKGTFKVSVNVAANSEVYFNLTYQELLQRRFGVYQHVITIKPGQVVEDLRVDVYIRESRPLTVLKVPATLLEYNNNLGSTENPLATVSHQGTGNAHISYSPAVEQQNYGADGHLVVEYDVQRDLDAGEIQVAEGYFVHYFAPVGLEPVKKTVLFILDTSSSMSGKRIQQLKSAMMVIIDDLRPDDKFAVMSFSDQVRINPTFKKYRVEKTDRKLYTATPVNKELAKEMVQNFAANGGTNINDALVTGITYLQEEEAKEPESNDARTSLVIFLTDGQPSTGITGHKEIILNTKTANNKGYPIFTLAFGGGAELSFLAKLSLQNDAFARQIYLDADPELQLQGFYNEISTPMLNNVKVSYVGDTIQEDSLTENSFHNYFDGSEIVVAGQLRDNSISTLTTQISGTGAQGYMELDMNVAVKDKDENIERSDVSQFTERLWAYLTIKKLLDKMVELDDEAEREQVKQKALELSLKYSFVTPLTSMVVTKPEVQADKPPEEDKNAPSRPGRRRQPSSSRRSFVDNDPHFIVNIDGIQEGVCFDIDGKPGDVYQLLHDKYKGITVNGEIVGTVKPRPGSKHMRTYFGRLAILIQTNVQPVKILISPHKITINGQDQAWRVSNELNAYGVRVTIIGKKKVIVTIQDDIVFTVLRHINQQKSDYKVDYLGFYVHEGEGLSLATHGLIGQFIYQSARLNHSDYSLANQLHIDGPLQYKHTVDVRIGKRRNMDIDAHVQCWFVRNNGRGLIEGTHKDYVVSSIHQKRGALIVNKSSHAKHSYNFLMKLLRKRR